jgi:short-subunit dehydrogenase
MNGRMNAGREERIMPEMDELAVVITGASSGVGRATAHAFARRGANLVLAARAAEPLEDAAAECEELGGRAVAFPADVTSPDAMRRLADVAVGRFGGLDVWVNNAGLGVVGRFHEVPIEAHRRVIETNLLGYMHGAHAALPHFIEQEHGVLINNVSIGGFIPTAYAAAYAASKFGVRAFSNSLRQELKAWPDIHVCAVYPFFMDTPGVQHGANYTGRALQPAPPVYAPEKAAQAIVDLVERPRRQVMVGAVARLAKLEYQIAPPLVEWGLARFTEAYLRRAESSPVTAGNLYDPMPEQAGLHGGWRRPLPRGAAGVALALGVFGAVAAGAMLMARPAHGRAPRTGAGRWRAAREQGGAAAGRRGGRMPELAPGVPMPPGVA